MSFDTLKSAYENAGQGHVFAFWEQLSSSEQTSLLAQLENIDPKEITAIAKDVLSSPPHAASAASADDEEAKLDPLPEKATASILEQDQETQNTWYEDGLKLIAQNSVAVILLAGGQGTRLGSSAPKGCYDVGLPSHKSLFQLQAERIAKLQLLASSTSSSSEKAIIPWYIMTSGPTRKPTQEFFESNNYFGLEQANVIFFEQGVLPCLTNDGKIILENKGRVAVAPDGNGGIYKALDKSGVLADLAKRNIKHLHTYCVDNSLVKVADPVFIGWAASLGVDIATKVVRKRDATESVGLIVSKNGRPGVIEYSEISQELAKQTESDSPDLLTFRAANIVNHYYSAEFLQGIPTWSSSSLPYHIANKKIPSVDLTTGEIDAKPKSPNGIKLEQFVFDVFPTLDFSKFACLEVIRAEEFSPLKNAPGTNEDSPETSRADLLAQGKKWLLNIGAIVPSDDAVIEISPLTSYGGEGLEHFSGQEFTAQVTIL